MYPAYTPLRHVETRASIHQAPAIGKGSFAECPHSMDNLSAEFIKAIHTCPAGTTRKVTDVFVPEERANRLRPAEYESAALGPNVESIRRVAMILSGVCPSWLSGSISWS